VSLDGRAREALNLLVAQYRQLAPTDSILPEIDEDDPEQIARLLAAVALCGTQTQWGHSVGVYRSLSGFLRYLGVSHLSQLADAKREDLSHAVWMCLRSVPDRKVSECVGIIRHVARAVCFIHEDFAAVHIWDKSRLCEFVRKMTDEDVAALFICRVLLGREDVTVAVIPSGGVISLMTHLTLVDWTTGLLGGREAIRQEAIEVLEKLSSTDVLALFWWGFQGCSEACAMPCPCYSVCPSLCEGLV